MEKTKKKRKNARRSDINSSRRKLSHWLGEIWASIIVSRAEGWVPQRSMRQERQNKRRSSWRGSQKRNLPSRRCALQNQAQAPITLQYAHVPYWTKRPMNGFSMGKKSL